VSLAHDIDAADWHSLLDRARRAERERGLLVSEVLREHDADHTSSARWCDRPACRLDSAASLPLLVHDGHRSSLALGRRVAARLPSRREPHPFKKRAIGYH
jgi:hypothetical protein